MWIGSPFPPATNGSLDFRGSVRAGQRRDAAELALSGSAKAASLGYVDWQHPGGEEFELPGH